MFITCVCCVGPSHELTSVREYYRECTSVCDLETSKSRRPGPKLGCCPKKKISKQFCNILTTGCHSPLGLCPLSGR
jgi:hypothetical protein